LHLFNAQNEVLLNVSENNNNLVDKIIKNNNQNKELDQNENQKIITNQINNSSPKNVKKSLKTEVYKNFNNNQNINNTSVND